jgi:putative transposase
MKDSKRPLSPDDPHLQEVLRFRYGVIAPLILLERQRGDLTRAVEEAVAKTWIHPRRGPVRISKRTIWNWLKLYRLKGPLGLLPKTRSDKGALKAFRAEILKRLLEIREDKPDRSTPKLLEILRLEGRQISHLRESTVNRHLDRLGKSRRSLKAITEKVRTPIVTTAPNKLWIGDFHHGPPAFDPKNGEVKITRLSAFIDHYSRLVPFGGYYFRENLPVLEDSFKRAVARRGVPDKVYVDNALVYHSDLFEVSCLRLGSAPPLHSQVRESEGRGAIERFFRTVKETFESEVRERENTPSLEGLNHFFWAWLEESYHREVHSETGQKPLQRFDPEGFTPRYPDPKELEEAFRIPLKRKVHPKTSTISLHGIEYRVEARLRKRHVTMLYDPYDLSFVVVYHRGERIQRAYPPGASAKDPPPAPLKPESLHPKIDYLEMVRAAYLRRLRQEAVTTAFRHLPPGPFGFRAFCELFEKLLSLKLKERERKRLEEFWQTFGPLEENEVANVLERCLAQKEEGRHLEYYLSRIRQYVVKRRRRKEKPS